MIPDEASIGEDSATTTLKGSFIHSVSIDCQVSGAVEYLAVAFSFHKWRDGVHGGKEFGDDETLCCGVVVR
ncbi:unnamed protein product [Brassica oleracea var. botrytis]|uniref:(rape) hypothetical protein n=1 Tax=Brassica napus TaxID=3708 RepID=A0A816KDH0_BRANA|nr:unnamed protein product [Brassica napus]